MQGDPVRASNKIVTGFVVLIETTTPELINNELVASAVKGALALAEIVGAQAVLKEVESMGEIKFGE